MLLFPNFSNRTQESVSEIKPATYGLLEISKGTLGGLIFKGKKQEPVHFSSSGPFEPIL